MEISEFTNSTFNNTTFPSVLHESCNLTFLTWVLIGLGIFVLFITVFGNALVILAIVLVKSLRNPRHYLLLSLAVADFLVGLVVIPFKILISFNCGIWVAGPALCKSWLTVDISTCAASVFGLTAVAVDRYFAILYPLKYKVNSTHTKTFVAIAVTWMLGGLAALPHFIFFDQKLGLFVNENFQTTCSLGSQEPWSEVVQLVFAFFIPMGVVLLVYGKIMIVISSKNFSIRKTTGKSHVSEAEDVGESLGQLETGDESEDLQEKRKTTVPDRVSDFLQEYKGCIIVGIIMGVFVICWFPYFTLVLVNTIFDLIGKEFDTPGWLFEFLLWLGYFNSCANPMIYTMLNKEFRQAFKDILSCRCGTMGSRSRQGRYLQQVGNISTKTNTSSFEGSSRATRN